jgi:hypothetical protein
LYLFGWKKVHHSIFFQIQRIKKLAATLARYQFLAC